MANDITTILQEVKTALNLNINVKTYSLDEYCDRYTAEFEQSHDVELDRSFVVRDIDPTMVEPLVTGITNLLTYPARRDVWKVWHDISVIHAVADDIDVYHLALVGRNDQGLDNLTEIFHNPGRIVTSNHVGYLVAFIEDNRELQKEDDLVTATLKLTMGLRCEGYVTLEDIEVPRYLLDPENADDLIDYLGQNHTDLIENAANNALHDGDLDIDRWSMEYELDEVSDVEEL
jgi:hypothetical protein